MRVRAKPKFAVILAPSDSGLNSHIYNETAAVDSTKERKWASGSYVWNSDSTEILHIRRAEVFIHSLDVKLDGELIICLLNYIGECLAGVDENPVTSLGTLIPASKLHEIFINAARDILLFELTEIVQRASASSLRTPAFIEYFHYSPIVICLELQVGQPDASVLKTSSSGGAPMLSYVPGFIGSIARASPTVTFNEKTVENYFGPIYKLLRPIGQSLKQQAMVQIYKVTAVSLR
jgi:hypothetical protein